MGEARKRAFFAPGQSFTVLNVGHEGTVPAPHWGKGTMLSCCAALL